MKRYLCLLFCVVQPALCLAQEDAGTASPTKDFAICMENVDLGAMKISQWLSCYEQEYKRQEAFLNTEYQSLRSRLPASLRGDLRDAQRVWLNYRAVWCRYEGSLDVAPSAQVNGIACMVDITTAQVRKLKYGY